MLRVSCAVWAPFVLWCPKSEDGGLLTKLGHGITNDVAFELSRLFLNDTPHRWWKIYDITFRPEKIGARLPFLIVPWLVVGLLAKEFYKAQIIQYLQPFGASIGMQKVANLHRDKEIFFHVIGATTSQAGLRVPKLEKGLKLNPPVEHETFSEAADAVIRTAGSLFTTDIISALDMTKRFNYLRIIRSPSLPVDNLVFALVSKNRSDEFTKRANRAVHFFLGQGILKKILKSYQANIEDMGTSKVDSSPTPITLAQLLSLRNSVFFSIVVAAVIFICELLSVFIIPWMELFILVIIGR